MHRYRKTELNLFKCTISTLFLNCISIMNYYNNLTKWTFCRIMLCFIMTCKDKNDKVTPFGSVLSKVSIFSMTVMKRQSVNKAKDDGL